MINGGEIQVHDLKHKTNTEIKRMRISKSLTQEMLAKELGVGLSTIAMIETGKRTPSLSLAKKIAVFFEVKIEDLF